MSKFDQSMQPGGVHHFLGRMSGVWQGVSKLWIEPGKLADETPVTGTVRAVLGGRFILHEYENTIDGKPVAGLAIIGNQLSDGRYVTAWIDSWHNGTSIMLGQGEPGASAGQSNVVASYGDGQGGPDWHWRTTMEIPAPDRLLVRHYNIPPDADGEEYIAVEFDYMRVVE